MLEKLKQIAKYFTVSWLDGQWAVFIEKMNEGIRVDVFGDMSEDLDVAISTAIEAAQQKMPPTAIGVDWAAPGAKDVTVKTIVHRENGGG